jgi:hypothetical protein
MIVPGMSKRSNGGDLSAIPPVRLFVHLGEFPTGKKPVGFQWKWCQHPTRFFVKIVVLSKYPF